jgi:hypothetical protein
MHKSAISMWKASRANVPDLPDCFPGMNEAQFANLAFDQHCHVSSIAMSRTFGIIHVAFRSVLLLTFALWTGYCVYDSV